MTRPQALGAAQPAQSPPSTAPPPQSPPARPPPATTADGSVPHGRRVTVQSIDNTFRPDRIEIAPGTEVVWVNRGRNEHDISSEAASSASVAADFQPGDEYSHVFTEPASIPYYCTIHGTADHRHDRDDRRHAITALTAERA